MIVNILVNGIILNAFDDVDDVGDVVDVDDVDDGGNEGLSVDDGTNNSKKK